MYFDNIKKAIDEGIEGKNQGLPTGFNRLDNYISLKKKMMIAVIGSSGSGKSSFANTAFILNPMYHCISNKKKIKIILFSMERSIIFSLSKWLIARIFQDHGVLIDMRTLLGWWSKEKLQEYKLTPKELQYINMYSDYFNNMENILDIYEGQRSPNDIFRIVKNYAESVGIEEKIGEHKKIYIPNDPDEQVIIVVDHVGLTKTTKEYPTKKQAIDRTIEHLQYFRDYLGYTVIPVCQLNRDLSNPLYKKLNSFEPHLDNIKESSNIAEASDLVLSLWEPIRYGTTDKNYGDVEKFRSPKTGHKYFRSISILKNSYGIDGASIGTVFMGETGIFKELPKAAIVNEWTTNDFDKIFSNEYFLT